MFDYENDGGPDIETIRSIAADIAGSDKPPAMTDDEREEWQSWCEQQSLLAKQRQLEYEQERFALAEAERLESEQRADTARYERNRQLQEQMREQNARLENNRQIGEIHRASVRTERYRNDIARHAQMAASRQRLIKALDNALAMKYPPPPPEPPTVIVEQDDGSADFGSRNFDVAKWAKKPRSWWC